MILRLSLAEIIALFFAALLLGALAVRWLLRWRHLRAVSKARQIAARLRTPATTLAAVEDRAAAIEELCQYPDVSAAVEAARELLACMDATVRSGAIDILRRTRALDLWARDLQQGNYAAKLRAIEALAEVGDERAMETLVHALGDDDPDVARAASEAIGRRDRDYASELLARALSSPDRRIAETAAAALVRLGEDAVEALVSTLSNLSAQARRLAVESLQAIGDPKSVAVLLPMLDTDPSPRVRAAVAEAICRLGCEEAGERLRRLAQEDPDWFVRARSLFLMAEMRMPGAEDFLLSILAQTEGQVNHSTDDTDDVEAITEGLSRVRSAAAAGLRLLGVEAERIAAAGRRPVEETDLQAPPEETGLPERPEPPEDDWVSTAVNLRAGDPVQRAEAARKLAESGAMAVPYLRTALGDPDPLVRSEAARALGRVGEPSSLAALAARLQDPDPDVRLAVSNAMRGIVMRQATSRFSLGDRNPRPEDLEAGGA